MVNKNRFLAKKVGEFPTGSKMIENMNNHDTAILPWSCMIVSHINGIIYFFEIT